MMCEYSLTLTFFVCDRIITMVCHKLDKPRTSMYQVPVGRDTLFYVRRGGSQHVTGTRVWTVSSVGGPH